MTYQEAIEYLKKAALRGSRLSLGAMQKLLAVLDNPQDELEFIHIAGTNGKGSVLAYTSEILVKAGIRTGRYSSPSVIGYLERFWVDGQWIKEDEFASIIEKTERAVRFMEAEGESLPTAFEIETAAAFLYFCEKNCRLVVLEAGLGGSLDATNAVTSTAIAAITSISKDHMKELGETLEEIAACKAGIIKPFCTVITAGQLKEVMEVLNRQADLFGCPVVYVNVSGVMVLEESYRGQAFSIANSSVERGEGYIGREEVIRISLPGRHQIENALLAYEIIKVLISKGYSVTTRAILEGFASARWPGRFTCIGENPVFIVDGAHNMAAVQRLRESLKRYLSGRRLIFIMGIFKDKEYERIVSYIAPLAQVVYTVDLPDAKRTLSADALRQAVHPYVRQASACRSVLEAVEHAVRDAGKDGAVVAFGSLSYLGEVMKYRKGMGII